MPTSTFQEQGTVTPVASVHVDYVELWELDRYCHWPRHRRETADKLGENESAKKIKKDLYVSFEVEAGTRNKRIWCTICCMQPTAWIALHQSSTASHISSRTWIAAQKPGRVWVTISFPRPFAWFLPFDFSLAVAINDATGHAWSGAKKYRTRSRKKVSGRRFKTRSVGLVEAETFFCLAWEQ